MIQRSSQSIVISRNTIALSSRIKLNRTKPGSLRTQQAWTPLLQGESVLVHVQETGRAQEAADFRRARSLTCREPEAARRRRAPGQHGRRPRRSEERRVGKEWRARWGTEG